MNIITTDQLLQTALTQILAPLYEQYQAEVPDGDNFDEWLYNNLSDLGEALYNLIGDEYGDADDAASELL
jgi:hypothetical protein